MCDVIIHIYDPANCSKPQLIHGSVSISNRHIKESIKNLGVLRLSYHGKNHYNSLLTLKDSTNGEHESIPFQQNFKGGILLQLRREEENVNHSLAHKVSIVVDTSTNSKNTQKTHYRDDVTSSMESEHKKVRLDTQDPPPSCPGIQNSIEAVLKTLFEYKKREFPNHATALDQLYRSKLLQLPHIQYQFGIALRAQAKMDSSLSYRAIMDQCIQDLYLDLNENIADVTGGS
jgi:hypothetical protein